jgi:hypothetical protein
MSLESYSLPKVKSPEISPLSVFLKSAERLRNGIDCRLALLPGFLLEN